ncbi:MAG: hypothetical protein ACRDPH_13640 [Marmoricola sp.]
MTYDGALWGALACALTALGGVGSYVAWRRRGVAAGVRGVAWSLLPIAAWLTGTLRLLAHVLGDIGDWAVRLVFSPTMWLGICLVGVAVVLFGASALLRRRTPRDRTRATKAPHRGKPLPAGHDAADPAADPAADGVDDEIEAILRKHGIQ